MRGRLGVTRVFEAIKATVKTSQFGQSLRRRIHYIPEFKLRSLKKLPQTLEYVGEFSTELILFIPFCYWLSKVGLLKNRRIRIYKGMRCFYDELDCRDIVEKDAQRRWIAPHRRSKWLPIKDEHSFDGIGRSPYHIYPDLRQKFSKFPLIPDIELTERPLLIVHNKHNNEWNLGPVNHLSLEVLEQIFSKLTNHFTIVYIRHGMAEKHPEFSDDQNATMPFNESELLGRFPEVRTFDDLYKLHHGAGGKQDFNTFKNVLYSRCFYFISSQGGGAHQIGLYSGTLMAILHRRGSEERWAYGDGYYGFMAHIPPIRAICRTESELVRSLELFSHSSVALDRVCIDPTVIHILTALSPWTITDRVLEGSSTDDDTP